MHGAIAQIDVYGTIVQMRMRMDDGRMVPVNFDHRLVWHVVRTGRADRVIGCAVTYNVRGPTPNLQFDDEVAATVRSEMHRDADVA